MLNNNNLNPNSEQNKGNENEFKIKLFKILKEKILSRRMAATLMGYPDQTYMVTETILEWIENGTAQVINDFRCSRSNRIVQGITTNPELFESDNDNQLKLNF